MKHKTTFILAMLIVAMFLLYIFTFQVNFNEAAVVETFGRAEDEKSAVFRGDSQEGGMLGNLRFRFPPPIQYVHTFDTRVQLVEDRLEEVQLKDHRVTTIQAYVAWRIAKPLEFYRTLRTVEQAQKQLRERLRATNSAIGEFTFDDLTNTDPAKLKLDAAEKAVFEKLKVELEEQAKKNQPYGVEIIGVGIKRIILPEAVANGVFEQMKKTREDLAQGAKTEGEAQASVIVAQAESTSKSIMSFARSRAESIRAEGDASATKYYEAFQKEPELAILLRRFETYREVLAKNTTFLIDANKGLFQEFVTPPTPPSRTAGK